SQRGLTLVDMKGNRQVLNVPQKGYKFPRASPDGNWLAGDVDEANASSIYIYRLSGASQMRRLTLSGHNRNPVWTRDSQRITYQSDAFGDAGIFTQRADGNG